VVAAVVGVLAGWPVDVGDVSLGQERALLVGNLIAFVFALRTAVRLTFQERVALTPTVRELSFRAERRFRFVAGQYLELEVPHPAPMRAARAGSSASSRRRRSCPRCASRCAKDRSPATRRRSRSSSRASSSR
jgi:hypothetical protein